MPSVLQRTAIALGLLLPATCGRAPESTRPLLVLAPSGPRPAGAEGTTARRLEPPADLTAWTYQDVEPRLVERDGAAVMGLAGGEQHWIRVPGPFDPARVNLAVLEVVGITDLTLRVGLSRKGEGPEAKPVIVSAYDFAYVRAGEHARREFDLRGVAEHAAPFDELLVIANGKNLEWSLVAIEVSRRPVEFWVPDPEGPPELVRAGLETRRATGLSSRWPLGGTLRVPPSGRLRFAHAWPWRMPRPSADAAVTVSVLARDASAPADSPEAERLVIGTFPLPRDAEGWIAGELDLGAHAGRAVTIRFELDVPAGTVAACALAEARVEVPHADPPTVLLVTSDTHRADHAGVAESGVDVATPTIDRLAREGAWFGDCWASSSITIPSHAALFTSLTPRDTGVTDNQTPLGAAADTLVERFAAAGYRTWALTSAKHMNHPWSGLGQGFDRMTWPMEGLELTAEEGVAQLEAWLPDADGQPLFVWLHLYDAHRPYDPPEEFQAPYYPKGKDPFDPALPEPDFAPLPGHPGLRDVDWVHGRYRGEVSYLDGQLGRLLARPRFARAVVAFTSDHGENLGEHELFWNHNALYPNVLHVPLVLRYPGVRRGARVMAPVRQIDVGHTLLAAANLAQDPPFPGRDLRALVDGAEPPEEPRYAISSFIDHVAIQQGRWFLMFATRASDKNKASELGKSEVGRGRFERHAVELYDLSADPRCEHDLVDAEPERARILRALVVEWISTPVTGVADTSESTPESVAMLEALGYGGGEHVTGSEIVDPECECAWCARFR